MQNKKEWLEEKSIEKIIPFGAEIKFRAEFNLSPYDGHLFILENDFLPERYKKNPFSIEDQKKLFKSSVSIIGCGATGQAMLFALANTGIGNFNICDHDRFEASNLNRQLFASENNLGELKVDETKKAVKDKNSCVNLQVFPEKLEDTDADSFIGESDIIIDCLDNISSRIFLEDICIKKEKPLIHTAVSSFSTQLLTIPKGEKLLSIHFSEDTRRKEIFQTFAPSVFTLSGMTSAVAIDIILGKRNISESEFLYFDLEYMEFLRM